MLYLPSLLPPFCSQIYEALPCYDFVYSPSPNAAADAIAAQIMANNVSGRPKASTARLSNHAPGSPALIDRACFPPSSPAREQPSRVIPSSRVLGFTNVTVAENYMAANPRTVQMAFHLTISANLQTISYGLQLNGVRPTREIPPSGRARRRAPGDPPRLLLPSLPLGNPSPPS